MLGPGGSAMDEGDLFSTGSLQAWQLFKGANTMGSYPKGTQPHVGSHEEID